MPRRVSQADAVATIAAVTLQQPTRTVFVGVDGPGAAGKTTFAARVAAAVPRATVVHVDDFAGPHVTEWDWDRFHAQLVVPLSDGRPARYQRWAWDRDDGAEWQEVAPGHLVVVEGVSSTRDEVGLAWDVTVWVEAPGAIRLERVLDRDGAELMRRWLDDWMPSERRYITAQSPQDRADLIVSGTE